MVPNFIFLFVHKWEKNELEIKVTLMVNSELSIVLLDFRGIIIFRKAGTNFVYGALTLTGSKLLAATVGALSDNSV